MKKLTILELCQKEFKTEEERLYIAEHIHLNVPFFFNIERNLITTITKKMGVQEFKAGENIYIDWGEEEGDTNLNTDKIFIIFKGSAVVSDLSRKKDKVIKKNWVIGWIWAELSVTTVAQTDCQMLVIDKEDYDSVISDSIEIQNFKHKKYLRKLDILKSWSLSKREEFWDAFVRN